MWVVFGIFGFLAVLITVILLLPVYVILRNDENDPFILRYKFLHKTFGENPNPNDPIVKALKKSAGIERFEKQNIERSIQQSGVASAVSESYEVLLDLLKQVVALLKYCVATKFKVKIVCGSADAAEAAIQYGRYSAATYSLLNLINAFLRIRKRGCDIDIRCDFTGQKEEFRYDIVISVRVFRVLTTFFRVAYAEARRVAEAEQQKNQSR